MSSCDDVHLKKNKKTFITEWTAATKLQNENNSSQLFCAGYHLQHQNLLIPI